MNIQNSPKLKYGGWGVAVGVAITLVIGFSMGGWVTASTAKEQSYEAVVADRATICVAQFSMAPDYDARLQVFKDTDSWKRASLIEEAGWSKMPGEEVANSAVSYACVDDIEAGLDK